MAVEDTGSEGDSEFETDTKLLTKSLKIPSRQLMDSSALLWQKNMRQMGITAISSQKTHRRLIAHHM
jgi:hypothetical protein